MADEPNLDNPTPYPDIAKQLAAGLDDAGVFEKVAASWAEPVRTVLGAAIGFVVKRVARIGAAAARIVFATIGDLDPAFGGIAAAVVSQIFDVEVSAGQFASITDGGNRKQIGISVGKVLLSGITEGSPAAAGGQLQPDVTAAENFLGVMANLAIEGWTIDLAGEFLTLGVVKNLGELNELMASVLGLGRLSRTVLRPFVNTLVAMPATWAVNKQYRPKMLTVSEAIAAQLRGDIDEGTLLEIAARDGYGDDALQALRQAAIKTLSPADAYFLELAGQWQQQDVIDELRLAGRDESRAQLERNILELQALHKFELELVTAAASAYAERKIDEATFSGLLSAETIDTRTLARLHESAAQKRKVNVLHMTRGDVESAVELEILSVTDYRAWLHDRGYGDDDALTLELLLQAKLQRLDDAKQARAAAAAARAADRAAKLQAQQLTRARVAAEHAHWTGTLGEAERLVVRSVMPPTQYSQVLIDHGLSAGDAAALTAVAVADRDARVAAAQKRAELASKVKAPTTSIAALEHAVMLGARSVDDFRAELVSRNYAADDVQLLVDLVTRELADRAALQAKRDALAAAGGGKQLPLGELEAAVIAGAATIDQFRARLVAAKYSATDIATLVALLQLKLKDHAFALERRALADARLEASHVSLANEEKAVVDGILTTADYQQWLTAHGFDDSDVAIMTALLDEKLAKKAGP